MVTGDRLNILAIDKDSRSSFPLRKIPAAGGGCSIGDDANSILMDNPAPEAIAAARRWLVKRLAERAVELMKEEDQRK